MFFLSQRYSENLWPVLFFLKPYWIGKQKDEKKKNIYLIPLRKAAEGGC